LICGERLDNVPIGLAVLVGSRTLVEADLHKGRLDLAGTITSIGGMTTLVYGISRAGEHGWTDSYTLLSFAAASVLLPIFIIVQARGKDPLVPLGLLEDRNRAGSYLAMLFLAFGPMGAFYLLTLYMQHIVSYSPITAGLAWLPFGAGIILGAGISSKLLTRLAPRRVAVPGMLVGGVALFWLSTIGREPNYVSYIMPAIFGVALGFAMGSRGSRHCVGASQCVATDRGCIRIGCALDDLDRSHCKPASRRSRCSLHWTGSRKR
jgi:predicted MFS family arabinose efflux permease